MFDEVSNMSEQKQLIRLISHVKRNIERVSSGQENGRSILALAFGN